MKCKRYSLECKRGCTDKCVAENVYCPSNGTEGEGFVDKYCMNCLHCDPDPNGKKQCEILLATLCYYPNDPRYPLEWQYNSLGQPYCTKHVNWDWGKNGDPDDPDNPNKPPDPPDPDQLDLFPVYPDERHFEPIYSTPELLEKQKTMKIKQITSQYRRDFTALMECQFCGHEEELDCGYDDRYFHDHVIPEMKCRKCNRSTNSEGATSRTRN